MPSLLWLELLLLCHHTGTAWKGLVLGCFRNVRSGFRSVRFSLWMIGLVSGRINLFLEMVGLALGMIGLVE